MSDRAEKFNRVTKGILDVTAEIAKSMLETESPSAALLRDAGLALLPGAGSMAAAVAIKAYSKRQQRKLDEWFGLVAMFLEMNAVEELSHEINDHIDESWVQQGVVEGVRAILNDIEDAALPSLARLTAHRLKARTMHDARDKRLARLLCECDRATFCSLSEISKYCRQYFPKELTYVELVLISHSEPAAQSLRCQIRKPGERTDAIVADFDAVQSYFRVFHLLKQHEFALDNPGGAWDGLISGPQVAVVSRDQVEYLSHYTS